MSDTVTVACKLPHGLVLRLYTMIEVSEPTAGGSFRKAKRAQVIGEQVVVKGYITRFDRRKDPAPAAQGSSYALTHGVNADFFNKWLEQNADLDAVKNNLIWAHSVDMVEGFVKEHEKQKSGLEPIDPENLPRGIQAFKKEAA